MPPELMRELAVSFPLIRRDPHYFLPTSDGRHLLMGADRAATEAQLGQFFSRRDAEADRALQHELSMLREDVAPTWLQAPLSIEETAGHIHHVDNSFGFADRLPYRLPVAGHNAATTMLADLAIAP